MKRILVALSFLVCLPAFGQDLAKYIPLGVGICEDVQLPCVRMIAEDTPMFFAVFDKDKKLIAITKMVGKKETTVWGQLPLKPHEKRL